MMTCLGRRLSDGHAGEVDSDRVRRAAAGVGAAHVVTLGGAGFEHAIVTGTVNEDLEPLLAAVQRLQARVTRNENE
jgi:hypothetical protein